MENEQKKILKLFEQCLPIRNVEEGGKQQPVQEKEKKKKKKKKKEKEKEKEKEQKGKRSKQIKNNIFNNILTC